MIISFYFFFTWFTVGILFTWPNRLPKQPHALAFLLCMFLNTNICYLLDDPFHFFKISKEMSLYFPFIFDQTFIMPAVVALMCNAYFCSSIRKSVVVLISICAFLALDLLARGLHLYTYTGIWHVPTLVGYRLLLLLLSILAVKGLQRMCKS